MDRLDEAYRQLLHAGLLAIRNAADGGDWERCRAEAVFLHNIPSLLAEPNRERHLAHVRSDRRRYLEWVRSVDDVEVLDWVKRMYVAAWVVIDEEMGLRKRSGNVDMKQ